MGKLTKKTAQLPSVFLGGLSKGPGSFAFGTVLPKDRVIMFVIDQFDFKIDGFSSSEEWLSC